MPNITAKELLDALEIKYFKAAILREVTLEDAEEAARYRTALVQRSAYYRRKFAAQGLDCTADLPENYDPDSAVLVRRIDALMWEGAVRTAVEVKISRADFFRDTDKKRYIWRKHTHRFVYLVPRGLVTPDEVPAGCGLWEYEDGQIYSTKKSVINKDVHEFPATLMKYFVYRAFSAEKKVRSLDDGIRPALRRRRPRRPRRK